jgi:hypothetical protein
MFKKTVAFPDADFTIATDYSVRALGGCTYLFFLLCWEATAVGTATAPAVAATF